MYVPVKKSISVPAGTTCQIVIAPTCSAPVHSLRTIGVGVGAAVAVGIVVGVWEGVGVRVDVAAGVPVGVGVAAGVRVCAGVAVGAADGEGVDVEVAVEQPEISTASPMAMRMRGGHRVGCRDPDRMIFIPSSSSRPGSAKLGPSPDSGRPEATRMGKVRLAQPGTQSMRPEG